MRIAIPFLVLLLFPSLSWGENPSPQRIVSLAPAYTETLLLLGLKERLAGVTTSSDYLLEAKEIPRVGLFIQPNVEKILSLNPDLVLASSHPGQRRAIQTLRSMGVKVEVFEYKDTEGIFRMVEFVGKLCGAEKEAEKLLGLMRKEREGIREKVKGLSRPRVYVEVGWNPPFTCGKNSFLDQLIEIAGGENIAHGIDQAYPQVNQEFVIEKDPQVIILPRMERPYTVTSIYQRRGWDQISAIKNRRVYGDIGEAILTVPSPRLILEGLKALAERIHPEAFDSREEEGNESGGH